MNLGIGFAFLMVVLGGAVAALGDWIGRVVGKKRIFIGVLRPKHTAIGATFLAGSLGTLLVIVSISVVSAPVRTWLLEGEKVKRELDQSKKELTSAREDGKKALEAAQANEAKLVESTQQLTEKEAALSEQTTKLTQAEKDATDARAEVQSAKSEAAKVREEIKSTEAKLASSIAELDKSKKSLETQKQELITLNATRTSIEKNNAELSAKNLSLTNDVGKLEASIGKLDSERTALQTQLASLQQASKTASEQYEQNLRTNEAKLQEVQERLASANREVANAETYLREARALIQATNSSSRFNRLTFHRGDEVSRTVIPAGSSGVDVMAKVDEAIAVASQQVRRKNSQPQGLGATLVQKELRSGKVETPQEQINAIVNRVIASGGRFVVIARSILNSFEGERTAIELELIEDRLVYKSGFVIAESRIDGSKDEDEILNRLLQMINGPLKERAQTDGILPMIGNDTPIGEVTREQILSIVTEVRASQRTVRVQFTAAQDTYRSDRLKLNYRLRL